MRRFIRLVLLLSAVTLLGIATFPLWFPFLLPLVLHAAGVSYRSYERVGSTRFVLTEVQWEDELLSLRVERIKGKVSYPGFLKQWVGAEPAMLLVENGQIKIGEASSLGKPSFGCLECSKLTVQPKGLSLHFHSEEMKVAGEPLCVEGAVKLANLSEMGYWVKIRGENMALVRVPGMMIRADIELKLQSNGGGGLLKGEIVLKNSFLTAELAWLSSLVTSSSSHFSVGEPFSAWTLGVQVHGDRFLRVQSPVLETTVSADLELKGTLEHPIVFGSFWLNGGKVKFPFAEFDIERGQIKLNPTDLSTSYLDVEASARAYGYDLRMQVAGIVNKTNVNFYSIPSLDSSQILQLVSTGQNPKSVNGSSTSNRLGGLGVFLGKNLLSELGVVGNKISRLQLRMGEAITERGKDTVEIEYPINDRCSVNGQYDRFDEYNIDLKWRVYPYD